MRALFHRWVRGKEKKKLFDESRKRRSRLSQLQHRGEARACIQLEQPICWTYKINGKDGRRQPGSFLNIKTAAWCLGRAGGPGAVGRTWLPLSGKILNTEIIAIRRRKIGWELTFQHEARHRYWAGAGAGGAGMLTCNHENTVRSRPSVKACVRNTRLSLSSCHQSGKLPAVLVESAWREAAFHFKWEVWTGEISAAVVRGLGKRWLK